MLLVADPAIKAVLLAEAVFGRVAVLFEQKSLLGLDRLDVVGMHAGAPELRILQIFVRAVAEEALDVLADEGRRVIAARLEAVDHGRRALEQEREPLARSILCPFGRLTRADVAPRAHDFGWLTLLVADEMLLVIHPAKGAVLAPEAIFDRVGAFLEQIVHLGLDPLEVVGVNVLAPEVRIVEIFAWGIAEEPRDVVADGRRGEIAFGLEAVDHRR